jgi:hypothetical protein
VCAGRHDEKFARLGVVEFAPWDVAEAALLRGRQFYRGEANKPTRTHANLLDRLEQRTPIREKVNVANVINMSMDMRDILNVLFEADRSEILRQRAALDQQIQQAREAVHTERTRENIQAFHRAVAALERFDETNPLAAAPPQPSALAAPENDYRGQHTAPMSTDGSPLWNVCLNGTYPEDFYSWRMSQYLNDPDERAVTGLISTVHERPNYPVVIYRAIPEDAPRKINVGDWVTTSRRYALMHGRSHLQGAFVVTRKSVYARDIFTDGNSLLEWGYDPQPRVPRKPKPPAAE